MKDRSRCYAKLLFISISSFCFQTTPLCAKSPGDASELRHGRLSATMADMKRRGNKKNSSATGAPPAGFLSALEMEAPIHYSITQSRKERVSFCEKTTDEIMKRVYLDLIELADRIDNP
ncbi:MAG TPA: hypothetical protein VFC17_04385, partial [Candidatus Limnocylindrales bacterium]|nr:hypothetical protein [Candidatus Limnocylindrales bacterium]